MAQMVHSLEGFGVIPLGGYFGTVYSDFPYSIYVPSSPQFGSYDQESKKEKENKWRKQKKKKK